ncbi:uracil-DNA glycosylase [uncultured Sphingosinicella sp.]|uniref:uracil-DNA glycosylase n=1 Tax=uncultured Sphingosinicella sp. TaxID=478748 RepID=UPI0030D90069|tara:strand:+ start:27698 stop:28462 length:765 start_codon:yes stop_codon:yes gene_type:complete
MEASERDELLATLGWWVEAGVDALVEAAPRDWRTPPPRAATREIPVSAPEPELVLRTGTASPPATVSATTIAELRHAVEVFEGCPLRTGNVSTVFADGNPEADLMLIGEAPGAQEDRMGLPFVGPAGQLLDRMLAAIGRNRTSAYITNVTFWRPPGNRTPTPAEVETTMPFVRRHIALVRPKVIIALGACAARALTGDVTGIMRLRGQWRPLAVEGTDYPLMPTLHPAFLLRQPDAKRLAWADLLAVKAKLDAD